jgi:hypothetical protein
VWFYTGAERGREALSKITFPNGQRDYYAGQRGEEVRHKSKFTTAKGSNIVLRYNNAGDVVSMIDELNDQELTTYT